MNKLLKFWQEQYDYFENKTAAAVNVAVPRSRYRAEREKGTDLEQYHLPEDVNLHKVAAWAMVSRAILNLDETVTRE